MTKSVGSHPGTGRPGAPKVVVVRQSDEETVQIEGNAPVAPKRMKVFFTDVKSLLAKRATAEARLESLLGPDNKRKRANCYKVIMQINRAIKHGDKCIKSPDELKRKRIQDKVKRVAKKLEKKRIDKMKKEVRQVGQEYHQ